MPNETEICVTSVSTEPSACPATAVTALRPAAEPSVHCAAAMPAASVATVVGDTVPPPALMENATLALGTGAPKMFVTTTRKLSRRDAPGFSAVGGAHAPRAILAGPT